MRKNLVLVSRDLGSGKKTIDFPFPIKGIEKGETEIYVNLDKRKDKIVRSAELLVWDLEERA